jgi:predicted dienelactone hydrolase
MPAVLVLSTSCASAEKTKGRALTTSLEKTQLASNAKNVLAASTDPGTNAENTTNANKRSGVIYQDWNDTKRNRKLPVKIYLPQKGTAPYPTVIFSHGVGGSREAATYLGEYLANQGYLCIFVQHPGSDSAVWEPYKNQGMLVVKEHIKASASPQNLINRTGDISFVIDELEKRNRDDALLGKQIDLNKIACSGHSFGAGTTLAIAGQVYPRGTMADDRIKAAMYLCPPINLDRLVKGKTFGSIKVPGLLLTGTEDDSPINDTKAVDRLIVFDEIKAPHQYLVDFNGANHATFGGGRPQLDTPATAKYHEMICKVAGEFLDATLRNDPKAWHWLDSSGAAEYFGKAATYKRK